MSGWVPPSQGRIPKPRPLSGRTRTRWPWLKGEFFRSRKRRFVPRVTSESTAPRRIRIFLCAKSFILLWFYFIRVQYWTRFFFLSKSFILIPFNKFKLPLQWGLLYEVRTHCLFCQETCKLINCFPSIWSLSKTWTFHVSKHHKFAVSRIIPCL